ncbi:hypothetical protein [Flavobacterium restrictum]|uniref:Uncharacterized protein n=1 Tax=Flavobacterium restrictum TaxID=2594428 RepID=A0A553DV27_9FLAO|nr:hypothetical protein [Flavobacterium restrictum]TRX36638.1 hypothetical protein FNW21_13005 [Flavobacterium restrictum]
MTLHQKIKFLENVLNQPETNYSDIFKADISMFFDEDFSIQNTQFEFLKPLESEEQIQDFIDNLLSHFVLKFDSQSETESDFIHYYLNPN